MSERFFQPHYKPPLVVSVDSCPLATGTLVGGEWAEVKTLAIGKVTRNTRGEICTQHVSTFSRLAEAASFEEVALVETHRRGPEQAAEVFAVQDGAEWLQGLVDHHCADALRILDVGACHRIRQ